MRSSPSGQTQPIPNRLASILAKPRSLQFTLTLRIAAIITVGLSTVTLWTCWKTQDILLDSYKQSLQETAHRIEEDVTLYREMLPLTESIQKALKNRAANNLWIGVKRQDETLLVKEPLDQQTPRLDSVLFQQLIDRVSSGKLPQTYELQGHHFIACSSPFIVNQMPIGTLYLVHDMTEDQAKFNRLAHSLIGANLTALVLLVLLVAYEARRLLLPLRRVSQMTQALSVNDLGEKQIEVPPHAPQEVQELVKTFNMLLHRLSEAWQQQGAAAEQQRQFVSNVSHELRTPLTIVRGYLDSVLRRGQTLTDSQQDALSIASAETDHTIRILKDLLDLARADDGYMTYKPELFVLNDTVADVIKLAEQVNHRQVVLEASELVPVYADPHRLKQVLVNLVENSIKYSDPDTPVTIQLEQQQRQALIRVCDRGFGIPLKHQSRIFERFYRIDEARNRSGGTGLGLALVKTFVEGMGGTVTVRSTPNEGSTFTVALPTTPSADKLGLKP
ncbi:sensor histidine kinase [Altericista sp. CCNU0014]|uniref:sensor histidine kinase n=1 Tax=Altericista sp. CCNU0014 TaxID=3082949 RepID=UPI00384D2734